MQNREITVFGDGEQKRNVTYIDDAVNALILSSQEEKTEGEVLFAVSNEHFSVAEIARLTVEDIGSGRVAFIDWPQGRKNIDIGDAVISNKKIKDLLGWSPKFNIKTGLGLTKDYYQSCLDKYLS